MMELNSIQLPNSEAWFYDPAFKKRFDASDRWMQKYLVDFADRDDDGRLLLSMDVKCEMPLHDDATVHAATRSMKTIFDQGWSLLTDGCTVKFSELQNMPGYYFFQLSDTIRAVVAKVENRMFFLALDSEMLTNYFSTRDAQRAALHLTRLRGPQGDNCLGQVLDRAK